MSEKMKKREDMPKGVMSPADSLGETTKNAGGMPPTWDPKEIFAENTPPKRYADNSTDEGNGSAEKD